MDVHQFILVTFALSVVLAGLLVAGRLGWCAYLAIVARRYRIAALAALGIGGLAVLFLAVAFMAFLLAVSHMQKDLSDTYGVMAFTGIPYFLGPFGLWRLAARFRGALR